MADLPHTDESLLNIYEVELDGQIRHLIGFLAPEVAHRLGIASRKIVGEFQPTPEGEFDPATFEVNEEFIQAYTDFMNEDVVRNPELMMLAMDQPDRYLTLIDPRHPSDTPDLEVPIVNKVGRFRSTPEGFIQENSFQYNQKHLWFDPEYGVSGVFLNREFYDWLNQDALVGPDGRPAS